MTSECCNLNQARPPAKSLKLPHSPVLTYRDKFRSTLIGTLEQKRKSVLQFGEKHTFQMHYLRFYTPASYSRGPWFRSRPQNRLSYRGVLWFSSVPPGKFRDSTLNWATIASCHILHNSSFTYHPYIRRCINKLLVLLLLLLLLRLHLSLTH
jgi:hypothetical protein